MTGGWFITGESDLHMIRQGTAGFANEQIGISVSTGEIGPKKSGESTCNNCLEAKWRSLIGRAGIDDPEATC